VIAVEDSLDFKVGLIDGEGFQQRRAVVDFVVDSRRVQGVGGPGSEDLVFHLGAANG